MDLSATLAEIETLSIEERIHLVQAIWDTIAAGQDHPDLSESHKRDLDRRIADLEASPENALTWEEIKSHVREGRGNFT